MDERRLAIIIEAKNKARGEIALSIADLKKLQTALSALQLQAKAALGKTMITGSSAEIALARSVLTGYSAELVMTRSQLMLLEKTGGISFASIANAADNASKKIYTTFTKTLSALMGPFKGFYELVRGMFIRLAAVASIFSAISITKAIVSAGAFIEQQRAILEALTGSAKEAGDTIEWVKKKAIETPFEVPGLIEATTQLRSVGLGYKKWFEPLGTLAIMTGRSMEEGMDMATRAVVRLKSGVIGESMELLRRMKVTRADFEKQGIVFGSGGKVLGDTNNLMEALYRIIETKFPGVMEKLKNTSVVAFSNIKDAITSVYYIIAGVSTRGEVMAGGFLAAVRDSALSFLKWFESHQDVITSWGNKIGQVFVSIITWIKENISVLVSWGKTVRDIFVNVFKGYYDILLGVVDTLLGLFNALRDNDSQMRTFSDTVNVLLDKIKTLSERFARLGKAIGIALAVTVVFRFTTIITKAFSSITIGILSLIGVIRDLKIALATLGGISVISGGAAAGVATTGAVVMTTREAIIKFLAVVIKSTGPYGLLAAGVIAAAVAYDRLTKSIKDSQDAMNTLNMEAPTPRSKETLKKPLAFGEEDKIKKYIQSLKVRRNEVAVGIEEISKAIYGKPIADKAFASSKSIGDALDKLNEIGAFGRKGLHVIKGKYFTSEELKAQTDAAFSEYVRYNKLIEREAVTLAQRKIVRPERPDRAKATVEEIKLLPLDEQLKSSVSLWEKYISTYKSFYGETAPQTESALQSLFIEQSAYSKIVADSGRGLIKNTEDWTEWAKKVTDARLAVVDTAIALRDLVDKRLEDANKALEESAKKAKEAKDALISLKDSAIGYYNSLVDFAKNKGQNDFLIENAQLGKKAATDLIHTLSLMATEVDVGTEEWYKLNTKIVETIKARDALAETAKFGMIPEMNSAAIEQAKAYLDMIKEAGAGQGAMRKASFDVINAEKEKVGILQQQLAYYESINNSIDANKARTEIMKVKTEILSLQKSMRGNLKDEFDKLSSMIINAPANITRILAKAGITSWERQRKVFQQQFGNNGGFAYAGMGASSQPSISVKPTFNITLFGKSVPKEFIDIVDQRIHQYGIK